MQPRHRGVMASVAKLQKQSSSTLLPWRLTQVCTGQHHQMWCGARLVGDQVLQQLPGFGEALWPLLPQLQCCNHWGCGNMEGVSGCGWRRARTTSAVAAGWLASYRYCSKECQALDWPRHKAACKRLTAAAGPAAAVAAAAATTAVAACKLNQCRAAAQPVLLP
ncbi:hypothetical protein COO60DRAFT_489244 [Scenedesmus sp. NREL 46B-D3]|nr:hypothetical protein COO60DRAFT_489244 [Scenedesmus sp. NREL 46B-D3]